MRVQWKLFISMFAVAMIILLILWACQVLMMSAFYQTVKTQELKKAANEFIYQIEKEGVSTEFEHIVLEGDINVRVINMSDFEEVFTGGDSHISATHDIGNFEILRLYALAKENAGEVSQFYTYDKEKELFMERAYNGPLTNDENAPAFSGENGTAYGTRKEIGVQFFPRRPSVFFRNDRYVDDFLYVKLVETQDGEEIMVISDVQVTPLDSTVIILKAQLEVTSIIALFVALVVSYIVSRHISKPIEKLNKSALELARGNFDTEFSGKGYREIEQLSDTLNFTAAELGKVEQFRNELLANVSHDLRTPLTMIGGYAEVMRDIPGENTPENLQVIIDETGRLTSFVNDMLNQSKLKSGIEQLKFENVNITELLKQIRERYVSLTKADGHKIELKTAEEVYVKCDENRIRQALYNLMDNALNHTGDDKFVEIRQIVSGKNVRIEISDTGKGIPQEELPYIWDRYYRADSSHKRAMLGSGIGLSIVKSIFEAHKLKYGVETNKERGSVFWVEFRKAGDISKEKNYDI